MADTISKKARSELMAKVKGKNTSPEMKLRSALHKAGFRYSLKHSFKNGRIKPDIVMVSRKICILIDGCFWHGCPKHYRPAKSNKKYWIPKIKRNIERDKEQNAYLKKLGWKVVRVWEHEVRIGSERCVKEIKKII